MQSQLFIAIALTLVCGAASQTVVIGGCDRATPLQQFNLTRYMGKWYEIEATNHIEEVGSICMEARYAEIGNGSVEVLNTAVVKLNNETYIILGYADKENANNTEAKFLVNFPSVGAYNAPYWVMDTDYTTFAIVWSCRPYGGGNSLQTLWYLNREPEPEPSVNDLVRARIAELNLDHLNRTVTVRENCPIIP